MGSRVSIVDERDPRVTYDTQIARIVPDVDYTAERGAQVIGLRVHVTNDWDDAVDVYDRVAPGPIDRASWDYALINGRMYRRVCRMAGHTGHARIYDCEGLHA
jgi:hypothetical protein